MSTFALRSKLIDIARRNLNEVEVTKNRAPWIAPLWTATNYPDGMANREPYCAAGVAWCVREWLKLPDVLTALRLTAKEAEKWRCKSAGAYAWADWARQKGLMILERDDNFHTGDLIIYKHSHIELYTGDLPDGRFTAIGYNTNSAGARDGEGCFEKPRTRDTVKEVVRILQ